jgi:hypothetical protein
LGFLRWRDGAPASDSDMRLFLSDCEEALKIIPENEPEMRRNLQS